MNKKFLLIICEGTSDRTTLYLPTKNYIKKKNITIQPAITHGDIALKENATKESCEAKIKEIILKYKKQYSLYPSDFFGVYHIIDTDGTLSPNDVYVQVDKGYYINEKEGLIYSEDINKSKKINQNKREIYSYLLSLNKIANVDYKVLFFSRNLEHALYNKANCSNNEKVNLSNNFESEFENDEDKFYQKINECSFNVPHDYKDSWDYIMYGSNSMRRGTNYIVLLDLLKEFK